jgi:ribosomal 50S subunit-associated protein YjgA (DUF615 family)
LQHVRKLLTQTDTKQIDELFDALDNDHGGTLDVPEMKAALKKLYAAAASVVAAATAGRERLSKYQERLAAAKEAHARTRELESTRSDLEMVRAGKLPMRERVGRALVTARVTVTELVRQWGFVGDGLMTKAEWRTLLAKLVEAEGTPEAQVARGPLTGMSTGTST